MRAQIGARINEYNAATHAEAALYDSNADGRNPRGVRFLSDWQGSIEEGYGNTSVGTYLFGPADINGTDCFHPSTLADRLAEPGRTVRLRVHREAGIQELTFTSSRH